MPKGGSRAGSGRKPKATEIELIEKLGPLEDVALKMLAQGVKSGDYNFVKLYMEYRYGKPKQQTDITSGGDKIAALPPVIQIVRDNGSEAVK